MANRKRKISVNVYLSDQEYDLLKRKTSLAGFNSYSEFIRQMIVYGIVYTVDFSEMHQHNFLLSNLTNNLNQIAHQANSSGLASNEDLKNAKIILEDVWRLQKSMLSNLLFKNP
ncbi:MAG: plasmid mobilization relaxosome protein MobC [Lachnospiraceae bacterium]|nr:plasmid mobilization relaxosome protein MobC [Lachnospiraceae bacterium]